MHEITDKPLSFDELDALDAYWRAAVPADVRLLVADAYFLDESAVDA